MEKPICQLKDFYFYLKKDSAISKKEKMEMHNLLVSLFPTFKKLYDKNIYYSTVRPQMNFLIKRDNTIVGTGKFLWRNVKPVNDKIKLFAFGLVIAKDCQGRGLGAQIVKLNIEEAKKRNADVLYATTSNPIVDKMLNKFGFKKITTKVFYTDCETNKIEPENDSIYAYEFKQGLINKLNNLPEINIGIGPL